MVVRRGLGRAAMALALVWILAGAAWAAPRPPAVTGLTASATGEAVSLAWKPPAGDVAAVRVRRRELVPPLVPGKEDADPGTVLAELPPDARAYTDREVKPGLLYLYRVAAVGGDGREGPAAGPVAAILEDTVPPAPPARLEAVPGEDGTVTVRWTPSPSDDVTQVQLFRRIGGAGAWAVVGAYRPGTREVVDRIDPRAGYAYGYAVAALDAGGNLSALSPEVVVHPPDHRAPAAPVVTRVESGPDGVVRVSWAPPPDPDVAGYRLYRSGPDGEAAVVAEVVAGATGAADPSAVPGVRYRYAVTAVDRAGNESRRTRGISAFARPKSGAALAVPGPVTARRREGAVELAWPAGKDPGIVGYLVYRSPWQDAGYVKVSKVLGKPGFRDEAPLPAGWYRVRTVYTGGRLSEPSPPAGIVPEGKP